MSYEEKQQPSAKTHSISMENRTKLNVTGVEDVESFDENAIIMNTSQGRPHRARHRAAYRQDKPRRRTA